jgi:hypothetical protein
MALPEFWTNVWVASGLVPPLTIADSPRIDTASIESALRRGTQWLTPRAVHGFDETEFSFLTASQAERLAKLVEDFREVAAKAGPTAPAAPEVLDSAMSLFREIVEMLEFDRYGDAGAYRLGKQIERELQPCRPTELAELRFNLWKRWDEEPR